MKVVLVGQAPNREGRADRALIGGRSGDFLMALTGNRLMGYARSFDRVNLLDRWPGSAGKGDLFPRAAAKAAADDLAPGLAGRRVVLLGRGVSRAFGHPDAAWFEWGEDARGFRYAAMPHPSPVNLFWNLPSNRAEGVRFFRRLREAD